MTKPGDDLRPRFGHLRLVEHARAAMGDVRPSLAAWAQTVARPRPAPRAATRPHERTRPWSVA